MRRAPRTGTIVHITDKELRKPYSARVTTETFYDENGKRKTRKKCLGYFATYEEAEQALDEYVYRDTHIEVIKEDNDTIENTEEFGGFEKMINMETIRFIKMIEELTELSKNEIIPFNKMTGELQNNHICYDMENKNKDGSYKVPLGMCLTLDHHDIYAYYEDYAGINENYTVGVVDDEEGKYIQIQKDDETIVIEKGKWYFA